MILRVHLNHTEPIGWSSHEFDNHAVDIGSRGELTVTDAHDGIVRVYAPHAWLWYDWEDE